MPRKNQKLSAVVAESHESARLAVQLRARGLTYDQIAQELGHKNKSSVYRLIQRELKRTPVEDVENLRKLELERLARLDRELDTMIEEGKGAMKLEAIRAVIAVSHRRSKLFGLDAPVKSEITGKDGAPLTPAEDDRFLGKLARLSERLRAGDAPEGIGPQPTGATKA